MRRQIVTDKTDIDVPKGWRKIAKLMLKDVEEWSKRHDIYVQVYRVSEHATQMTASCSLINPSGASFRVISDWEQKSLRVCQGCGCKMKTARYTICSKCRTKKGK